MMTFEEWLEEYKNENRLDWFQELHSCRSAWDTSAGVHTAAEREAAASRAWEEMKRYDLLGTTALSIFNAIKESGG